MPSADAIAKAASGWGAAARKAKEHLQKMKIADPDRSEMGGIGGIKDPMAAIKKSGFKMPKIPAHIQKAHDKKQAEKKKKAGSSWGKLFKNIGKTIKPRLPSFPAGFKPPKLPKLNFGKWAETFKKMVADGKKNFAVADVNNDERVDKEELTKFIADNLPKYQAQHAAEFKKQDADNDGFVTELEHHIYHTTHAKNKRKDTPEVKKELIDKFNSIDLNSDGKHTAEEQQIARGIKEFSAEKASEILIMWDKDSDGKLTSDEFFGFHTKHIRAEL